MTNLKSVMRQVEIRMAAYATVLEYVNSYLAGTLTAEEAMDQVVVEMASAVDLLAEVTGDATIIHITGCNDEASTTA
jgi:hypothetical protein